MDVHVDIRKTLEDRRGRRFTLQADFSSGENFVVLFGPSGSGKSMTLRAIAGLLRPDRGSIRIGGQTLFDSARGIDMPTRRRRVGYLFQEYALFPHLSVADNVAFPLRGLWRWGKSRETLRQAAEMLELFELGELAQAMPHELSGGQRQRVALARALANRPDLLLLDEPFAALNPLLRAKMRAELLKVRERFQVPVILITHDQEDVEMFGDTLVQYEEGRVRRVWPFRRMRAERRAHAHDGSGLPSGYAL